MKINDNQGDYFNKIYEKYSIDDFEDKKDPIVYTPYFPARKLSYMQKKIIEKIGEISGKKILVIGGGIDGIGIFLEKNGNIVISTDISEIAIKKTKELAEKFGTKNFSARILDWNNDQLNEKFDVIITHDALHHLNVENAVNKIYEHLYGDGEYIAVEPYCELDIIIKIHEIFRIDFSVRLDDEIELRPENLRQIQKLFSKFYCEYFDFLSRESVVSLLYAIKFRKSIFHLGKIDSWLIRRFPFLKKFSSAVIIMAKK